MYAPNDILIRKTSDGETIWLSQRVIAAVCGISEAYLRVAARDRYKQSLPKSWSRLSESSEFFLGDIGKSWRWGRKGGQYYYDYDRIPDRAPTNYRSMLPSKDELIAEVEHNNLRGSREREAQTRNNLLDAVSELTDNEDVHVIQSKCGFQIDIATARDYAKALAWCRLVKRTITEKSFELFAVKTAAAFYDLCAETISTQKIKNLKTHTANSLRNKVASMPSDADEQRSWIISGKYGNRNRMIVGKIEFIDYDTGVIYPFDIHQAIMYSAYMNFNGPEKETLKALYEDIYSPLISEFELAPVEYRTFCNHLTRFSTRLKNDRQRHGEDYYNKHLLTYIPTQKLAHSHSLFCGDGSGLFSYRYKFYDKEKKREVVKTMNLYAMLVSDVATGCITGWSVSPKGQHLESGEMVKEAVKMSVKAGGGQTMCEFVSDNHGAFTNAETKEWLNDVFGKVRTIQRGNSQANPAETLFRLFKGSTLRSMRNFVRTSHSATIANRANLDKVDIYEYPTYEEAIEQLKERIEKWNNTPRPRMERTPAELFAQTKNPICKPMDEVQLRKILGKRTKAEVTRMRGFVKVGSKGRELMFEIPNYETTGAVLISRATGNGYYANVDIVYDESGADLYSADGKFIISCPPINKASSASAEKSDEQSDAQSRLEARKRRQLNAIIEHEESVKEALNVFERWSYSESMAFGGCKEQVNGEYEEFISREVAQATTRKAEKELRKIEKAEKRTQEKAEKAYADKITIRHREIRNKRVPDLFK